MYAWEGVHLTGHYFSSFWLTCQRFSFPCLGFLLPSVHLTCSKGHVIEMNVRRRNLITARKGKHVTRILSLFSSSRVTCLAVRGTEERFHSRSCISLSGFNKEEKKVPDSEWPGICALLFHTVTCPPFSFHGIRRRNFLSTCRMLLMPWKGRGHGHKVPTMERSFPC